MVKKAYYWSEEEVKILRDYADKCHYTELVKVLPGRSVQAIIQKARNLGIDLCTNNHKLNDEIANYIKEHWGKVPMKQMARDLKVGFSVIKRYKEQLNLPDLEQSVKWTEQNLRKLRELAKTKTVDDLAKYFKTTQSAIYTVACKEGISLINSRLVWTEENISLLRELAKTNDVEEISLIMGISTSSIRTFAKKNNVILLANKRKSDSIWTDEDTEQLITLANEGKTLIEISIEMDKNDRTINKKAKELDLNIKKANHEYWTKEEIEQLIELSKSMSLKDLVQKFNRTSTSISKQAKKLGITIVTDRKSWTKEECKLLEKLVLDDKKKIREIAQILGRTEDSVALKIKRQGLVVQNSNTRAWTPEEKEMLTDLWGTISVEKIAKKLNRTILSIKHEVLKLGLGSAMENNYDGLRIQEICDIFHVDRMIVDIAWVSLGLKFKTRRVSETFSYRYVEINDLFEFLEANQNIWDSRNLELNILGKEPDWLKEKRVRDRKTPIGELKIENLTKYQLVLAKQYYLETLQPQNNEINTENQDEQGFQKMLER